MRDAAMAPGNFRSKTLRYCQEFVVALQHALDVRGDAARRDPVAGQHPIDAPDLQIPERGAEQPFLVFGAVHALVEETDLLEHLTTYDDQRCAGICAQEIARRQWPKGRVGNLASRSSGHFDVADAGVRDAHGGIGQIRFASSLTRKLSGNFLDLSQHD